MLQTVKKNATRLPVVLLHECEYMVRKTFSLFASEMNLATVVETSEINQAKLKLTDDKFDMIILGFDDWTQEVHLIELIRSNMTSTKQDIPIIVILPNITQSQIEKLRQLNISEILLKPARIKTIQTAFTNSYNQL